MEKKKTKKKEPQVIEIHIYVHQNGVATYPPIQIPPGGGGTVNPNFPPYSVTC